MIGEDHRCLAAVLRAVVNHVPQTVPEDTFAHAAFVGGVADGASQIGVGEGGEPGAHGLLVLAPACRQGFDRGEVVRLQFAKVFERLVLEQHTPGVLGIKDMHNHAAQATGAVGGRRGELILAELGGRGQDALIGPVVVVVDGVDVVGVHGVFLDPRVMFMSAGQTLQ